MQQDVDIEQSLQNDVEIVNQPSLGDENDLTRAGPSVHTASVVQIEAASQSTVTSNNQIESYIENPRYETGHISNYERDNNMSRDDTTPSPSIIDSLTPLINQPNNENRNRIIEQIVEEIRNEEIPNKVASPTVENSALPSTSNQKQHVTVAMLSPLPRMKEKMKAKLL